MKQINTTALFQAIEQATKKAATTGESQTIKLLDYTEKEKEKSK